MQEKEFDKNYRMDPFYSVYQPIVDIRTRKVIGYEALTRGRGAMKLPGQLYRRSYEEGLTMAFNLECLNNAFRILPKLGNDQLLFVNVEPVTMGCCFGPGREADFMVLSKIAQYRYQIVFELTEGMKIRDFPLVKRGVQYLKKLGCQFAIDDVVGIGAKLFQILSLKPEFVKIGIGLIRSIEKNPMQQDLTRQLIDLGRRNGFRLIAEGVERKKELEQVKAMGLHFVQGFYYSRPKQKLVKIVKR